MKKLIAILACLGLMLFPTIIMADVITFDDIDPISPSYDVYAFAPDYYPGMTFDTSFLLMSDLRYAAPAYNNHTYDSPSGDFAVFNAWGNNHLEITFDTPSLFGGAMFSAFTESDTFGVNNYTISAQSITVFGYLDGADVDSVSMNLGIGYEPLAANMIVDRLVFTYTPIQGQELGWWMMDNLDPLTDVAIPTPEPATSLLIGAGLLGIGLARRKFNK